MRLGALQGQRSTWWTGAAWEAHDSSAIWNCESTPGIHVPLCALDETGARERADSVPWRPCIPIRFCFPPLPRPTRVASCTS